MPSFRPWVFNHLWPGHVPPRPGKTNPKPVIVLKHVATTCANFAEILIKSANALPVFLPITYLPVYLPIHLFICWSIYLFIYLVTKSIYLSNPLINLSINPSIYPCVLVSMYTSIHPAIAVSLSLSHCLSVRPSVRGQTAMNIRRSPISDCSIAQCMIAFNMNKSDCVFLVLQGEPGTPVAPS